MTANLRSALARRWRGYRRLSPADRRITRRSWVLLSTAALLLKVLRLQTVVALVMRLVPTPAQPAAGPAAVAAAKHMAARFVTVANLHLLPTTCLPRAVALWWLLRAAGIDADIVLGVQGKAGAVAAHAWVEAAGRVVGDPQQIYLAYSTIVARYPRRQ